MHLFELLHVSITGSGITASAVTLILILTRQWHGVHSNDFTDGPQKFHTVPTSRIGGVAIFVALVISSFLSSEPACQLLGRVLLSALPAFAAGLTEDMTKRVSVAKRLGATIFSALLAWWLTGYSLTHINIWGIDLLLAYLPVAVVFTAFAVAGVANAVNIIDGFNGLAAGSVIISLVAIALVACDAGDLLLAEICLAIIAAIAGFMVFNFPLGKIFMGDGGAYLLGFLLAWIAVMLPSRNPEVSMWAPVLACAYPINETLFTMLRRFLTKDSLGLPDSSHLHSLVKIKIIAPYFAALPTVWRNSLVSPFCWAYAAVIAAVGVALSHNTSLLMAAWAGSFAVYALLYALLTRIKSEGSR